jgi:hypothetical protein
MHWQASSFTLKQWQKRQARNPQFKAHGRSSKKKRNAQKKYPCLEKNM